MTEAKRLVSRYGEMVVVTVLVLATTFAVLVAVDKLAFLSFFYVPVLVAGYFLGRRQGVMVALSAVLMVSIYAILNPSVFTVPADRGPGVALFIWGAFLIVTAYVVGTLYEARTAAMNELHSAYAGILDILTELIDAVDKYDDNHSVRVADIGAKIAVILNLPNAEIENIRVAGLLHDIRKLDDSMGVLRKAAGVDDEAEKDLASIRVARRAMGPTGGLLRNVVPLVEQYRECFDGSGPGGVGGEEIPLGARILSVADALDRLVAPSPYGKGLSDADALMELEQGSGTRFDPTVIQAAVTVVEMDGLRV